MDGIVNFAKAAHEVAEYYPWKVVKSLDELGFLEARLRYLSKSGFSDIEATYTLQREIEDCIKERLDD